MGAVTASVTTRPLASTAAAPWASCSSLTGRRAKVGGCEWGWGAHCSPLGASDPRCVLSALRKVSDLAQLDIAPSAQCGLVFASMGWGQESPPCTGTGTPCCRHHAWPHTPGKPMGRRKRGSGQAGGSGIALVGLEGPVPSQSTPPHCLSCPRGWAGWAGYAGNPHCSESVKCTDSSGNTAQDPLRCCTSHQHPHSPVPARQGTPGCFPCTPNLPPQGWQMPVLCLLAALRT